MRFVAFTGLEHHLARIRPVLDQLVQGGHDVILLTTQNPWCCARSDFEPAARRSGLPYRLLAEARSSPSFRPRLAPLASRLAAGLREAFTAGATPPFYVREHHLIASLWENIEDQAAFSILQEELAPDAGLVLHENNFWTRSFGAACGDRGTPLFAFQEGTFYDVFPDLLLREQARFATRVLLWGESDRERLVAAGVEAERLVAVGPPHLDHAPEQWRRREQARRELGIPPDERLALFLAPNLSVTPVHPEFASGLLDAVGKTPGLRLGFKWRSTEDGEQRRVLDRWGAEKLGPRFRSYAKEDPYRLLAAADMAFGQGTTLGAEAIALGTPYLEVAWGLEEDPVVRLKTRAGAEVIRGSGDLGLVAAYASGLVPLSVRERARRFREQSFQGLDGLAARRACGVIADTLARHGT